mmetsp:Transcript_24372/g.37070  ORF Transcript_24372/g.37070 Transcript_24372/m.37070 type:complete len:216 (+) Transcript_24372:604-1251(+)
MKDNLYAPGPYDVLCCKTSKAYNHTGNKRFRAIIDSHSATYGAAGNIKSIKSQLINSIVQTIRALGGCFLVRIDNGKNSSRKNNNQAWRILSMTKAKEKVGHSLRRAWTKKLQRQKFLASPNSSQSSSKLSSASASLRHFESLSLVAYPYSKFDDVERKEQVNLCRQFSITSSPILMVDDEYYVEQLVEESHLEPLLIERLTEEYLSEESMAEIY